MTNAGSVIYQYYARKRISDEDWKTQLAKGYEDIPKGAEIEIEGQIDNFYGTFLKVRYKGRLYYAKPGDVVLQKSVEQEDD